MALLHSRHSCRLSSSCFRSTTVDLKYVSILFILFVFASVSEGQKPIRNSLTSSTPSSNVFYTPSVHAPSPRRRISPSSTPFVSTIVATSKPQIQSDLHYNESTNNTKTSNIRSPVSLTVIIIVCSLMSAVTILGNLVVILAVILVRKLQTASNILIVSLAISDIWVGLLIMPIAMSNYEIVYVD